MKERKQTHEKVEIPKLQQLQEHRIWHRPQLQRLQLSLDTAFGKGSVSDFGRTGSSSP